MKSVIVIPSRYASSRFPGKPLAEIAGKSMVHRTFEIAQHAADQFENVEAVVATDDDRILNHVKEFGGKAIMTSDKCRTGTDRCKEAIEQLDYEPDFILNLQGDAPLTPPWFLVQMLQAAMSDSNIDMVTPVYQMSWEQLDDLRESKKTTPFSGTSAILDRNGNAIWFSKNIIPAVRNEEEHRENLDKSPVMRHLGLYGYTKELLKEYADMPSGHYEVFEGLEQLRALENGKTIRAVVVDFKDRPLMSGVDHPEDLKRAEKLIEEYGDPFDSDFLHSESERAA
jgi:3-deoxy-manno-octulosonate cytidylyltransferase (CMP-KDO synthetase)